jgi:hypothetical protein
VSVNWGHHRESHHHPTRDEPCKRGRDHEAATTTAGSELLEAGALPNSQQPKGSHRQCGDRTKCAPPAPNVVVNFAHNARNIVAGAIGTFRAVANGRSCSEFDPGTDLGTSKHIMPDPAQPHSEIEFQRLQYRSLILGGSHATARVHHPCWRGGDMAAFVSAITERVTVTIKCRGTAQVRVEHLGSLREKPLLDEIDHPLHRFTLIDRVGDHPFQPCG